MNHANAGSTGHAGRWVIAPALAFLAAAAAGAQVVPDYESIHIIPGAQRNPKAEALLQAGWTGGPRAFQVYRVGGSIEGVFNYYLSRLGGTRDAAPDSTEAPLGGTSSVTYHVVFHTFDDQCRDAAPTAPASAGDGTACQRWRRGKDKRKSLDGARLSFEGGKWIDAVTFTWFHRERNGELQRVTVEIRDVGLSPDWKQHTPLAQILIQSERLAPGAP